MNRKSALSIFLGAMLTAFAAGGSTLVLAQSDDQPAEEQPVIEQAPEAATEPAAELRLGETHSTAAWDLTIQSVFTAPSATRAGWTEVRVAASVRNNLPEPIPYSDTAFATDPLYPQLSLRDGSGTVQPLMLRRPGNDSVGGSAIHRISPGMTGRWTIGFQVETVWTEQLTVIAGDRFGGSFAEWDLTTAPEPFAWSPPAGIEQVAVGETIDWLSTETGSIEAIVTDYGSLVCGDPEREHVTHVFALEVDVANPQGTEDVRWPGHSFPDAAATAMWADGTSADISVQTFVGNAESLQAVSTDVFLIPPDSEAYVRALVFGPARDGRLGTVDDPPLGVLVNRPDAASLWLDLAGAPGDLPMNPALCDDGSFGATIPYAFGPSLPFAASVATPAVDAATQDAAAQQLLTEAAINAVTYYAGQGDFTGVSSPALENIYRTVDFTNTTANLEVGVVAWGTPTPDLLTLATVSGTGTYYCVAVEDGALALFASGEVLADILSTCEGDLPEEEADAAADGGEGAGTGEEEAGA